MTNPAEREPSLGDVLAELRALTEQVERIQQGLEQSRQELRDEVERWDERFFQFTRDNLTTARTIIVTAGGVIILSPVLQAFAPVIQALVSRFIGGDLPQ